MSKLKTAEAMTRQEVESRTEEMALALATKLDTMRQAKVSTSEELAEVMYPLLQAMTSLALENQVLLKEMRLLMRNEIQQARTEMEEMRALMTDLKSLLMTAKTDQA
ncbi:hypothetical protein [Zestomonas insulae]|uniref:hypothetical protein n=1 Tax=Zestomonas insulae TaxID=2809017 RepID=UPI001EF5A506|nr:hypothetical protein [Pseudomonas insulae]